MCQVVEALRPLATTAIEYRSYKMKAQHLKLTSGAIPSQIAQPCHDTSMDEGLKQRIII